MSNPNHYEYVRAIVTDGKLRWEYQLKGAKVVGRLSHDEDVEGWKDRDIIKLTRQMLDIEQDDPVSIEVQYN